jgi:hypothetical protein
MRLAQIAPSFIRRDRRWILLRRTYHEGWTTAIKRYALWSKILGTRPFPVEPIGSGSPVEVHLLCCEFDYLSAIWALKSFYHFARVRFPLAIHLQGRVPRRIIGRLRRHFPGARIITQPEADTLVNEWLISRRLERLRTLRRENFMMQKLVDFRLTCHATWLLILDSDVLFFATPRHLLDAVHCTRNAAFFQRDPVDNYNISAEQALERFGIRLKPRINAGLALVPRDEVDLVRCEELASDKDVVRHNGLVEQTLWALLASERIVVRHLPDSYLISLDPCRDVRDLIARHYAGPSRPLFTSEGVRALIDVGFLKKANGQGQH